MLSTFLFFALVAVMFFALQVATSFGLLDFFPAALEDGAGPRLSFGAWFLLFVTSCFTVKPYNKEE